ncbi:hypothetical protein BGX38DRAFT_1327137, partial [Terfezia claveryi]
MAAPKFIQFAERLLLVAYFLYKTIFIVSQLRMPSKTSRATLLGMLTHLMKWIQEFLDHVGRLKTFDQIWSRLPPFPGFTRPNKAYRSVSQWQGKEMRQSTS